MIASLLLSAVTILMPAESGMRGTEIELGEIVSITSTDAAVQTKLEQLNVSSAPQPGFRRVFTRADILTRIRRVDSELAVTFTGRGSVSVYPETVVVTGAEMMAQVDATLAKLKGNRDITWAPNKQISQVEIPRGQEGDGAPVIKVELESQTLKSGRVQVKINLMVGGAAYRKVWADWNISIWEELPVLTRGVVAGSRVSPDMFALRRTELPPEGIGAVLTAESMVGAIATRNLAAGSVVIETDVTRPKVIHTGDHITLIVRKGAIKAAVEAVALEDGVVGDMIRIKRVDSKTTVELKGRVVSSDKVEIDLSN